LPQAKSKIPETHPANEQLFVRLREGGLIGLVALCLYLTLALMSFDSGDPGWSYTGDEAPVANLVGKSGAWIADVLLFVFGYLSVIFPLMLARGAWYMFRERQSRLIFGWPIFALRCTGFLLTLFSGAGLATLHFYAGGMGLREGSGGILGSELSHWLVPGFGYIGATLLLLATFLFGLTAFVDISWLRVMDRIGEKAILWTNIGYRNWLRLKVEREEKLKVKKTTESRREALVSQIERNKDRTPVKIAPKPKSKPEVSERVAREKQGNLFKVASVDGLPALHLLDESDPDSKSGYSSEDLEAMSRLLELKLRDYNIEAVVVAVFPGPVITRFEIQPAAGVKVSRITSLVKDLARSLAVISVRVVEVIPGKSVVGIEIPNTDREMVRLGEVLSSKAYDDASSPVSLALGNDIAGEPVVVDLAKMPHMLVAGTTGSGKSVGINAMLLSLLFKASPDEVRLILVDPKMLELAVYEGIPHLLTPVVTDMKDAANALRWCVAEMERRYKLMSLLGVRNIGGYNQKIRDAIKNKTPLTNPFSLTPDMPEPLEEMPLIVVVIDELADLMMVVGKKIEELITRLAQKARAAGIHLLLATQRPSVDVITGLIKANIPTRIAFQVSSRVDSRTILDQMGAETLLGQGDMLYLPPGTGYPQRVHGAFVSDQEVHRVVEHLKKNGKPHFVDGVLDSLEEGGKENDENGRITLKEDGEFDPLYKDAVAVVMKSRRASISLVQRHLRIGYNRAARLIEKMEHSGLVSPMQNNGSREILAQDQNE